MQTKQQTINNLLKVIHSIKMGMPTLQYSIVRELQHDADVLSYQQTIKDLIK